MIEIKFVLTDEETVTLETTLYRRGREDLRHAQATNDSEIRERGVWLLLQGDLVKGQRRSQQKFNGG